MTRAEEGDMLWDESSWWARDFRGSILARRIAEKCGRKVKVIEKRPHIGGNMYDEYDEYDEHGILIQRYGSHFLNTDKYWIKEFLSQYVELFPHDTHLLSFIDSAHMRKGDQRCARR